MNPNADLNCRIIEVETLLESILDVQPKEGGGGGGESKESIVNGLCQSFETKYEPISFGVDLTAVEKQ